MTICSYCGEARGSNPCRNTRDMEEWSDTQAPTSRACFAALMILGGGERAENQRKAAAYQRLIVERRRTPTTFVFGGAA